MKSMSHLIPNRFLLTVLIFFSAPFKLGAKSALPQLGDRLVLELDRSMFSQRNLESYILTKHSIFQNGSIRFVNAENWGAARDEYLNDMIVDREASRLGAFRVNPQVMQKSLEALGALHAREPRLKSSFADLQLSHQQIQQQISVALRVEAFKRGKFADRSADLSVLTFVENELVARQAWFNKLKSNLMYRWFSGAEQYKSIRFDD
jgi:hypothetical protein